MNQIFESAWQKFESITLENDRIRFVTIPTLGAKIVSLYDKKHQHEWLVPPMRPLKQTSYGDDFVSQDMSGWDEMMPTISACTFNGNALPDHGEVWSIPWQLENLDGAVVLSVLGRALPYQFTRSAALVNDNCLRLDYTLTALGENPLPYLWAAHPQFNADPQTRILLPEHVTHMTNVIDQDPAWGEAGSLHPWPQAQAVDGHLWRLDRVREVDNRSCRKFYTLPENPAAWAALNHEGLGCQLRLDWSAAQLPYLGLWVDEGVYNARPVAAPEPCTGYYDSLERAVENNRVPVLMPGTKSQWSLQISLLDL